MYVLTHEVYENPDVQDSTTILAVAATPVLLKPVAEEHYRKSSTGHSDALVLVWSNRGDGFYAGSHDGSFYVIARVPLIQ